MKVIIDNKFIFFSLTFLICLWLYFPTFTGEQIWDDGPHLFENNLMTNHVFVVKDIFLHFNWATSFLAQKIMHYFFNDHYFYYRIVNFTLHFLNALLFFNFLRLSRIKNPQWGYLIFLLHPATLISVAWIIQFKTLLCGFFVLISLNSFLLSSCLKNKRKTLIAASMLSYLISLSAKSASLPLIASVYLTNKRSHFKKILLLPLTVLAALSSYRLISSPITQEGIARTVEVSGFPSTIHYTLLALPQTLNWYFWQAIFPLESVPIRGSMPTHYAQTIVGLSTLVIFFILIRHHHRILKFIGAGFIMLLPFLGIIPAPYMSSAWVSEQHLYLALLFFIPAFSLLIEHIPSEKLKLSTRFLSILFLGFISFTNIDNYKDELHFFKSSFDYNHNLPAAFHLLSHYVANEKWDEARTHFYFLITSDFVENKSEDNLFWAQILQFEPQINNN